MNETRNETRRGHAVGSLAVASVAAVDPDGWYPFTVSKFTAVTLDFQEP